MHTLRNWWIKKRLCDVYLRLEVLVVGIWKMLPELMVFLRVESKLGGESERNRPNKGLKSPQVTPAASHAG
jgi:hypothetical protein